MKPKEIVDGLARGLSALRKDELQNLKYHLQRKTTILCGASYHDWLVPGKAGCPAELSCNRQLRPETGNGAILAFMRITNRCMGRRGTGPGFTDYLEAANEKQVKTAIRRVLKARGV